MGNRLWIQLTGMFASGAFLLAIIWSIAFPQRRIWPLKYSNLLTKTIIWTLSAILIASALWLGLADWNRFNWPAQFRWGLGLPLIVIGNIVVGHSAFYLGFEATSGAKTMLKTGGFYRFSRNPQYTADLILFTGWAILSASAQALPIILITLVTLIATPFAEESWLQEAYGKPYEDYCGNVRRFL